MLGDQVDPKYREPSDEVCMMIMRANLDYNTEEKVHPKDTILTYLFLNKAKADAGLAMGLTHGGDPSRKNAEGKNSITVAYENKPLPKDGALLQMSKEHTLKYKKAFAIRIKHPLFQYLQTNEIILEREAAVEEILAACAACDIPRLIGAINAGETATTGPMGRSSLYGYLKKLLEIYENHQYIDQDLRQKNINDSYSIWETTFNVLNSFWKSPMQTGHKAAKESRKLIQKGEMPKNYKILS